MNIDKLVRNIAAAGAIVTAGTLVPAAHAQRPTHRQQTEVYRLREDIDGNGTIDTITRDPATAELIIHGVPNASHVYAPLTIRADGRTESVMLDAIFVDGQYAGTFSYDRQGHRFLSDFSRMHQQPVYSDGVFAGFALADRDIQTNDRLVIDPRLFGTDREGEIIRRYSPQEFGRAGLRFIETPTHDSVRRAMPESEHTDRELVYQPSQHPSPVRFVHASPLTVDGELPTPQSESLRERLERELGADFDDSTSPLYSGMFRITGIDSGSRPSVRFVQNGPITGRTRQHAGRSPSPTELVSTYTHLIDEYTNLACVTGDRERDARINSDLMGLIADIWNGMYSPVERAAGPSDFTFTYRPTPLCENGQLDGILVSAERGRELTRAAQRYARSEGTPSRVRNLLLEGGRYHLFTPQGHAVWLRGPFEASIPLEYLSTPARELRIEVPGPETVVERTSTEVRERIVEVPVASSSTQRPWRLSLAGGYEHTETDGSNAGGRYDGTTDAYGGQIRFDLHTGRLLLGLEGSAFLGDSRVSVETQYGDRFSGTSQALSADVSAEATYLISLSRNLGFGLGVEGHLELDGRYGNRWMIDGAVEEDQDITYVLASATLRPMLRYDDDAHVSAYLAAGAGAAYHYRSDRADAHTNPVFEADADAEIDLSPFLIHADVSAFGETGHEPRYGAQARGGAGVRVGPVVIGPEAHMRFTRVDSELDGTHDDMEYRLLLGARIDTE